MDGLVPSTVGGLPLHPLVVHATVVVVPLAAVSVLLAAVLPRFRRWAGWLPLLLAVGALVLTPLATSSGEDLEGALATSDQERALIEQHAALGEQLVWFVLALVVVALAALLVGRRERGAVGGRAATPRWALLGLLVLGLVVPLGVVVEVVRIGHSGAEAAWRYRLS